MSRTTSYRNIGLLFGCEALSRSGAIVVLSTMALAGRELASDPSLATLPLALVPASTMVMTVPAAHFMQRWGRQLGFVVGSFLGLAGGLVCAAAIYESNFYLLCAGAVGIGAVNGFATYYRFAAAEVADEEFKSRAISLVMAGGIVAALLGSQLAGFSDAFVEYRFAGSFLCIAVVHGLVLLILTLANLPKPLPEENRRESGRSLRRIARQPQFLMAIVGAVTSYGVMSLLMNATPLSMDRHHHAFSDTRSVIMWHVFGMYVPSFFTGHLIRWLGEARIMMTGGAVLVASILVSLEGTELIHYAVGLTLLGVGWNFLFVGSTSLLTSTYEPEERAKVQSTNDFLVFGAMVAATFSAGSLESLMGWEGVNQLAIAVLGVCLTVLAVLKVSCSRSQPQSA